MKKILGIVLFLALPIHTFAQDKLPPCSGNFIQSDWSNCQGKFDWGSYTYTGGFSKNRPHGRGEKRKSDGTLLVDGIWHEGELNKDLTAEIKLQAQQAKLESDNLQKETQERQRLRLQNESANIANQVAVMPLAETVVPSANLNYSTLNSKRLALVIGNAGYKVRPLKNSRNDADDVSRSLKTTGFEVIDLRDATLPQMRTAVRQFGDRLINNDVGLVYYSGHGVEVKGRNYFIPVNADIQREDEIADQGLDVSLILEKMSTAGKGVNILIVDACRDDPFGRSFRSSSRGLANMDAPRGTIIAYATSPGKVASDGNPRERNSPYTKHLVKAMQSPNKPIEQVFKEVRRAVQDETKNQQTPWENTSLSGDFFFRIQR